VERVRILRLFDGGAVWRCALNDKVVQSGAVVLRVQNGVLLVLTAHFVDRRFKRRSGFLSWRNSSAFQTGLWAFILVASV